MPSQPRQPSRRRQPPADVVAEVVAPPATGSTEEEADAVLDSLSEVVDSVVQGRAVGNRETVARLIHEQERRSEIIASLLLTHDQERLVRFLRMRKKLEGDLAAALETNNLSNADKVAFLNYINTESRHMEGNIKAGGAGLKDIIGMLVKLDYALAQGDAGLRTRLMSTTPQAREVVRKLAYRLARGARTVQSEVRDDAE